MKVSVAMYEDEWYPVYGFKHPSFYTLSSDFKVMEYDDYLTGLIYDNLSVEGNDFLSRLYMT